jgi:predicted amidophosphoribosyltransferase
MSWDEDTTSWPLGLDPEPVHPHEEVVLCIVCQRQRPPKGQMYCEDCWQKARKRMKEEEEA